MLFFLEVNHSLFDVLYGLNKIWIHLPSSWTKQGPRAMGPGAKFKREQTSFRRGWTKIWAMGSQVSRIYAITKVERFHYCSWRRGNYHSWEWGNFRWVNTISLHDKSLTLVMRNAQDNGRKALKSLQAHYAGTGKPRVISLYTVADIACEVRTRDSNRLCYSSRNCGNSS